MWSFRAGNYESQVTYRLPTVNRRLSPVTGHWSLITRIAAAATLCAALSSCGFQLRGSATLPFNTFYVEPPRHRCLQRNCGASSARAAQRVSRTVRGSRGDDSGDRGAARARGPLLSAGGRVREYQLRYRVRYACATRTRKRLSNRARSFCAATLVQRPEPAAGEGEEVLLFRDMQIDLCSSSCGGSGCDAVEAGTG